jgi:hypothetical protein
MFSDGTLLFKICLQPSLLLLQQRKSYELFGRNAVMGLNDTAVLPGNLTNSQKHFV